MTEKVIEMSEFPGRRVPKDDYRSQATLRIEGKIVVEVLGLGEGAIEVIQKLAANEFVLLNRKLFGPNCELSLDDIIQVDRVPEIAIVVFDSNDTSSVGAALPIAKRIDRNGKLGLSFDLSNNTPSKMKKVSNAVLPIGVNRGGAAEYLGVFLRGLLVPILTENFVGIEFSDGPLACQAGHSSWAIAGQGQGENRAIGAIEDAMNRATAFGKNFDDANSVLMTVIVDPNFTFGESAAMARMLDDTTLFGEVPLVYSAIVDDHRDESVKAILVVTE
ncbi:MAG: hypothetical protein FVQ80_13745 [Planctomycetes bacterium]|nr:hypothetical protein [Planctomycetota bacterium]